MRIEIEYKSQYNSVKITSDDENDTFICNGRRVMQPAYIFQEMLLDIVFNWEEKMINPDIKDAESYKINITTDNEDFCFMGQGNYPDNFIEFKNLILEVANE